MAKKVYGYVKSKGQRAEVVEMTASRAQKKSASTLIPWTAGPGKSLTKRAARALWG